MLVLWACVPAGTLATMAEARGTGAAPDQTQSEGPIVLFVHGIQGDYRFSGFDDVLDALRAQYTTARVRNFEYFQDLGRAEDGECSESALPIPSVETPNGSMPVDYQGSDSGICDSESDLGLNAVALHDQVAEINFETGKPVVLVSTSMGSAVVRGFLGYSVERNEDVPAMVDSLVSMDGAQDGSYLAPGIVAGLNTVLGPAVNTLTTPFLGDASRPAVQGLVPSGVWYQWANLDESRLPSLPTFNVYGDLGFRLKVCPLFLACLDGPRLSIGDTLLLPGTDDPFDAPPAGGARFLPGGVNSGQRWQWSLADEHPYRPFTIPDWSWALNHPAAHINLTDHLDDLTVTDCDTYQPVTLAAQLLSVIRGRMDEDPYPCRINEG